MRPSPIPLVPLLALLLPSAAAAATTGNVHVLLVNTGSGTFSPGDPVRVFADADFGETVRDQSQSAPSVAVAPGTAFTVTFSGLYQWDGAKGNYSFLVGFDDASGPRMFTFAGGSKFTGAGPWYVSRLGVTSYDPGSAYALDFDNAAPSSVSVSSCYPTSPNPAQNLYLSWSVATQPRDWDRFQLQRQDPTTLTWSTIKEFTTWPGQSHVDTSLVSGTSYTYRVAHVDRYDAVTYGPERTCTTANGDLDRDGYVARAFGGNDCNDNVASVHPGATEVANDGVDQDCDGFDLVLVSDKDADGLYDPLDNCVNVANADQADLDGDRAGDACDPDDDNDGVADTSDTCPETAGSQADLDLDGAGDVCDTDVDGDGVTDDLDVCPRVWDDQTDLDHDLSGDACDGDDDGDGVADEVDVCPEVADDQTDTDGDGTGDACDPDGDGDGVSDDVDVCVDVADADQLDTDLDGAGDACDVDDDNDGVADTSDVCPLTADPEQLDTDGDLDGNACDADDDADGVSDVADNCALDANVDQADLDRDDAGDACDDDDDGDTVVDAYDNCPVDANAGQGDNDLDGEGDACDPDDDNDAVADTVDICPTVADPTQADGDCDGLGDACDADDDDDDVDDTVDACPGETAMAPDLLEDGCLDDYCDVSTWLATLTTSDVDASLVSSLIAKADTACASALAGSDNAAMNKFEALIREAAAQEGKKVTSDVVDALHDVHASMLIVEACLTDGEGCDALGGCAE